MCRRDSKTILNLRICTSAGHQRRDSGRFITSGINAISEGAEHAKEEAKARRMAGVQIDLMLDQVAKDMVRPLMQISESAEADDCRRLFARSLSAIRTGLILP